MQCSVTKKKKNPLRLTYPIKFIHPQLALLEWLIELGRHLCQDQLFLGTTDIMYTGAIHQYLNSLVYNEGGCSLILDLER